MFGKDYSVGDERFALFKKQSAEVQADLELLNEEHANKDPLARI